MYLLELFIRYNVIIHSIVSCYLKCGTLKHTYSSGYVGPVFIYGKPDTEDLYCVYKINPGQYYPESKSGYLLTWKTFDVRSNMPDCFGNNVLVYTGCGSNQKEIGFFCSLNADKPFPIYSREGCFTIVYRLSKQGQGDEFTAFYKPIDDNRLDEISSDCPFLRKELIASNGLISTPYWPSPYRKKVGYQYSQSCKWEIAPEHTNVVVVIMDVDFASDKRPSALSSRRDVLKLGYSLDNKREGVTYSTEYSHWIEKKLYAKDEDTEKLYTASGFRVTFKVYENHYLDHKNGRGFLIGYMSYKKVTVSEKKDDDDGLSPFIIFVIVACTIGVIGVCSWYCSRHSTRRNENASSNEGNEEERRSLNRPSPNPQPRLIIHASQGDQELHHIDQRNSITSVNQTNGNLPDAQLSEEAPPAYNPHSNYPTAPPRSNLSPRNNINEEAPPPSYEDVLQGTYG